MDAKRYAEILKSVIQMQVIELRKRAEDNEFTGDYTDGWSQGVVRGLEIALEKIDASAFLYE